MKHCTNTIPKGLRPSAQGCEERATLGRRRERSTTLKGLHQTESLLPLISTRTNWFSLNCSIRLRQIVVLVSLTSLTLQAAVNPDMEKLASANSSFGFSLMKQLAGERHDSNIFISPYSISAALQMVWQGAAGDTKKEMDNTLALDGLKPETVGAAYKDLDRTIKSASSNAVLNVANSIWYAPNIDLKPQFVSINQNFYGAKLSALDFTDPRSAGVVNSWVSEQTQGKIKQIIQPPLSSKTGAFLANAIYFKGSWEHKFDSSATKDEAFHTRNGAEKQVPMMRQSRKFNYQEDTEFQAVRLPYSGNRLGMFIILPATNSSSEKLLAKLNGDVWREKFRSKFEDREGTVLMPRFKLEFRADLVNSLKTIGIRHAFTHRANFSGVSDTQLFISGVEHASFVEMNEEGTEAAAATGITMRMASVLAKSAPFTMIINRPFFFLIEDSATKSILFMGIVNQPSSE
jgi:serine protease inhibitor